MRLGAETRRSGKAHPTSRAPRRTLRELSRARRGLRDLLPPFDGNDRVPVE
jgi:hypothetical protein